MKDVMDAAMDGIDHGKDYYARVHNLNFLDIIFDARKKALEPEKRLMLAVLGDALYCLQKYANAGKVEKQRLYREADNWIFEDDEDSIFSFNNICEIVGINPSYLRKGIVEWKRNNLNGVAKDAFARRYATHRIRARPRVKEK